MWQRRAVLLCFFLLVPSSLSWYPLSKTGFLISTSSPPQEQRHLTQEKVRDWKEKVHLNTAKHPSRDTTEESTIDDANIRASSSKYSAWTSQLWSSLLFTPTSTDKDGSEQSTTTAYYNYAPVVDTAVASTAIQAVLQLAVAMAIAVAVNTRYRVLDSKTTKALAKLTYQLFQPSLIVVSVSKALYKAQQQQEEQQGHEDTAALPKRMLFCMPFFAFLEIGLGFLLGKASIHFMNSLFGRRPSSGRKDESDILLQCTFANSAPLPLLFASVLFADNQTMLYNVTACISFYLIVWSPCLYLLGPLLLASSSKESTSNSNIFLSCGTSLDKNDSNDSLNNDEDKYRGRTIKSLSLSRFLSNKVVRQMYESPPLMASITGLLIGQVPFLQHIFLSKENDGMLLNWMVGAPVMGTLQTFSAAYLPCTVLILAASLAPVDLVTNDVKRKRTYRRSTSQQQPDLGSNAQETEAVLPISRTRNNNDNALEIFRTNTGKTAVDSTMNSLLQSKSSGLKQRSRSISPTNSIERVASCSEDDEETLVMHSNHRRISFRVVLAVLMTRLLAFPILHIVFIFWLQQYFHHDWTTLAFVWQMLACMPPAQNTVLLLQLSGNARQAAHLTRLLAVTYVASVIPMALWMSQALTAWKKKNHNTEM